MDDQSKFSVSKFKDLIREIQRSQYFDIQILLDNEELVINDPSFLTVMTRSVDFCWECPSRILRWRVLGVAQKEFWELLQTLEKLDGSEKTVFRIGYLDSNGNNLGGKEYRSISVLKIKEEQSLDQEGKGSIVTFDIVLQYKTSNVFVG